MGKRNNQISSTEPLLDRWFKGDWQALLKQLKEKKSIARKHPKTDKLYDFLYVNFKRTRLFDAEIIMANMTNIKAYQSYFSGCKFENVNFFGGDFVGATITNSCVFHSCDFSDCDFTDIKIEDSEFLNCKFNNGSFINASFGNVIFDGCEFISNNFTDLKATLIHGNIGILNNATIDKNSLLCLPRCIFKRKIINGNATITSALTTYDVALSFAGEDRVYVEELASEFKRNGIDVFYDNFETASLWGKDLIEHLTDVYSAKSKYVIVFISDYYDKKAWTNVERRAAFSRYLINEYDRILPIVINEAPIRGLLDSKGYLDSKKLTIEQICDIFIRKFLIECKL